MKARIYINRHLVAYNKKLAQDNPDATEFEPVISIKTYKGVKTARSVQIKGPARLIQDFNNPICSGANIWIEVNNSEDIIIEN